MSNMTWRQLTVEIENELGEEDLDSTVTVYDAETGEFCPADLIIFEESEDIDAGTMFISINVEKEAENE